MKYFTKFLCLFLGAAMMLTMAACGSKSDTDANAGADGEKKQLDRKSTRLNSSHS